MNFVDQFRDAIRSTGLEPPAVIEADGKIHPLQKDLFRSRDFREDRCRQKSLERHFSVINRTEIEDMGLNENGVWEDEP